jgi:hypothetical protein
VGFEPTIQVFERAKTFHALDGAASVIGHPMDDSCKFLYHLNTCQLLTLQHGATCLVSQRFEPFGVEYTEKERQPEVVT